MRMKLIIGLISGLICIVCTCVGAWCAQHNDISGEVGWLFAALLWRLNMGVPSNETRS